MNTKKIFWLEPFYSENKNIAIKFFKQACGWILINSLDASSLQGMPRYAANILVLFGTAALVGWAFTTSTGIIELLLKIYLASFLPAIAFNKSLAASIFFAIEKYQAIMKKTLEARG